MPGNPIWDRLDRQRLARDKNAEGSRFLRQGVDFFATARYRQAVTAYEQAIAVFDEAELIAPGNSQSLEGKVNAVRYKREAEHAQRDRLGAGRSFSEGETAFVPAGAAGPSGFVADETLGIQGVTSAESSPGEIIFEMIPRDAEPGAPYTIKVRLRNKSNSTLFAKSLELVSTYRGRSIGKGHEIDLHLRRVDAQETAVLYDVRDTWNEELDAGGEITATVTLGDGGKLTKTLSWTSSP